MGDFGKISGKHILEANKRNKEEKLKERKTVWCMP
jgi:hypothetical protein